MTPQAQSRCCVQKIELKPARTVKDKLCAKLLIDGEVMYELPPIKKGQPLVWDTPLFCNAGPSSIFRLKVHEESHFGLRRTSKYSFEFPASDITAKSSTQVIERTSGSMLALISISNSEATLPEAVAAVQHMKAPQAPLDRLGVSRGALKTILDFGTAISEINPIAKAALAVLQAAWQKLEAQSKCDETVEQLLVGFADILRSIRPVKELARSEDLKRTINAILELIQDASRFIIDYKVEKQKDRLASALVSSSQDKVQDFLNQLRRHKENFDRELSVQEYLDRVNEELNKLNPVGHSTHHHRRPCLAGTRSTLIGDIDEWIQHNANNDNLLWVHGLAGLGKSSVATSVCQLLEDRNMLGASFFCKRDDKDLREPQRVIGTIIYRIARHYAEYGRLVVNAISNDPELYGLPMRLQYNSLAKNLLTALAESGSKLTSTVVVVVDALDECGTTESRRELLSCLFDMSRLVPWLKVIVTSRPDQDVKEFLAKAPVVHLKQINLRDYDASDDIYAFFGNSKFDDAIIRLLTERAAGLFIWAETASRFILNGLDPQERLDAVINNSVTGDATAQLNALYSTSIKSCMSDTSGDNLKLLKKCIGVIVATGSRTPMSVASLERLLDHSAGASERIRPSVLGRVVEALGSVLYEDYTNDGEGAVRVYHPSFTDYITTLSRSKDLHVDLTAINTMLSTCCLNTMLKELKFNICGLETSYRLNKDVPDLASRVSAAIGPHLSYSCQYWVSHITDADPNRVEIHLLRECLFSRTIFYWIEALSLLRRLDVAISALSSFLQWKHGPKDCLQCANDAYRFILNFYDGILECTPHLYLSVLPFAPTQSELVIRGTEWFPNTLKLVLGADKHWTACLRTMAHPDSVLCLGVSPDSRLVVSGCADYLLRIWDAETGTQVCEPLMGHSDRVLVVVFSPDGRHIASGSEDGAVRIWDAQIGSCVSEPFTKHSDAVKYVAFSPDGQNVASGSRDKTLRIWDVQTGAEVSEPLIHNSTNKGSVAFSFDDQRLISVDDDDTMRIWDVETGTQISKPLLQVDRFLPTNSLTHATLSPDGRYAVLSPSFGDPQILDVRTGSTVSWIDSYLDPDGMSPLCIAFSSDGRHIAAGFSDNTVGICDSEYSSGFRLLVGHSDKASSVAFSPDGRRVISCSYDNTMRIWDIENDAGSPGSWTCGPSDSVTTVAFSPDGGRIVSACVNFLDLVVIDIWDVETGANLSSANFYDWELESVKSLAFSSDGQYLISIFHDYQDTPLLCVWEVESGDRLQFELRDEHSGSPSLTGRRFRRAFAYIVSDSNNKWRLVENRDRSEPFDSEVTVTYSADGQRIVSASKGNTVQIWDAETGAMASEPFVGHAEGVLCAAFSPDGRRIVSGSYDKTVRIWDVETSTEVHEPFIGHSSHPTCVAFSLDGRRIVSGGDDGTIRIWNLDSGPASELPTNLSHFSRHMDTKGWVSLENKPCLFWVPAQYRRANIDDSTFCISSEPHIPSGVRIDFSRFVHGTSWTSVAAI